MKPAFQRPAELGPEPAIRRDVTSKLRLTAVFEFALGRLATRTGALLVAAYVLFQLVTQVAAQSLAAEAVAGQLPTEATGQAFPLAVGLPITVSGGLLVLFVVAGTALSIVSMRAFYRDTAAFPTAAHTRRLPTAVAVAFVVSVLVSVAVAVGLIFLVVPGVFLAVSLIFAVPLVAIEDAGVADAISGSWALAKGNRIRLFVLGVALVVASVLLSVPFTVLSFASPVAGDVGNAVASGLIGVFGIALVVGAYSQVADGGEDGTTPAL